MNPIFFETPSEFRAWLEENHDTATEVFVGFYKKETGKPTMTWSDSVDQALCFGWIDGITRSLGDGRYVIRFTPRRPASNWSKVNIEKVAHLKEQGLMRPAGLAAFEKRTPPRTGVYSYEQRDKAAFEPAQERRFKANKKAWEYFQGRPPGYRRTATWWVMSAKREETRERRLSTLIEDSAAGRPIALLARGKPKKK